MGCMILHSKHGLAPAMMFCRICGKDTNGIALLGNQADKAMQETYKATEGREGSQRGYEGLSCQRIPDTEPCDECKSYLNGGCIIIAKDTKEYLRLTSDMVDQLHGRVGGEVDGEMKFIDFNSMRGKVWHVNKAFWYSDGENIRLRDQKEWMS